MLALNVTSYDFLEIRLGGLDGRDCPVCSRLAHISFFVNLSHSSPRTGGPRPITIALVEVKDEVIAVR